jgi:hypothetical protein
MRLIGLAILAGAAIIARGASIEGFTRSPHFDEQVRQLTLASGVRVQINAPPIDRFDSQKGTDAKKGTSLIFYALPNGNTIEQTIGCQRVPGLDWHYDIQHIGAQVRLLRETDATRDYVIAYLEAEGRSWPAWRQKRPDNPKLIREIVDDIAKLIPGTSKITLACHSGGGSFIWGYLNGGEAVPDAVERIAFLDANYSYSDDDRHGDKLLEWLRRDKSHALVVLAYDDRNVKLDGKPIVSETGGTYRASHRMIDQFSKAMKLQQSSDGGFEVFTGMEGQIRFLIHKNSEVRILHTTLVGEMSGFLHAMTLNTVLEEKWGKFAGRVPYAKLIQPAPPTTAPAQRARGIPVRPKDAPGGAAFMRSVADIPKVQREAAIVGEMTRGNLPEFLRTFKTIAVEAAAIEGVKHRIEYEVMSDYLAVGSDADFVRVPMTPMSAQKIADAFECSLPTRKIVDDVYAQAEEKIPPHPLTEQREAVETFVKHNGLIELQLVTSRNRSLMVAGIKKDVVLTNRLAEKPNRVAIFGWHKLDGQPIQPLTIVHVDTYVDYSHGIRLVRRRVRVDGKELNIDDVLRDVHLCNLISDEGPINITRYRD